MDLKTAYEQLEDQRETYLDDAESTARMFSPSLAPRGQIIEDQPYTDDGIRAINSLSSTSAKALVPSGVQYFEMDLAPRAWTQIGRILIEQGMDERQIMGIIQTLRQRMNVRTEEVLESLEQKNLSAKWSSMIARNLVEGTNGVHNTIDTIRFFPLRSVVVKRDNGVDDFMIFRESLGKSVLDEDYTVDESRSQDAKNMLYTLVRFPKINPDTGELQQEPGLWQQVGDGDVQKVDAQSHRQFFYMMGEEPDVEDYARGYAFKNLRLVEQIDLAEKSLGQVMAIAGFNVPLVAPGSVLEDQIHEFEKWISGEPKVGRGDDISWWNSNLDISKWTFVVGLLTQMKEDLAAAFAMGIKDRPISGDTSATAVLQIIDELSTQTQKLVLSHERALRRLIVSEIDIYERTSTPIAADLGIDNISDLVQVNITTGANALEKQRSFLQFINAGDMVKNRLDQTVIWNGEETLNRLARSMRIEPDNLYRRLTAEEQAAIAQQQANPGDGRSLEAPGGVQQTAGGPQPDQSAGTGVQPAEQAA